MDSILAMLSYTASKSQSCQKHAAVLLRNRKVVSHVVYNDGPLHAEMKCLRWLETHSTK